MFGGYTGFYYRVASGFPEGCVGGITVGKTAQRGVGGLGFRWLSGFGVYFHFGVQSFLAAFCNPNI